MPDLATVCTELKDLMGDPFVAQVKVNWDIVPKRLRYFLIYNGSFSREDLNKLDKLAQKHNFYYEVSQQGFMASLDLPYATNYAAMIKKGQDNGST